MSGHSLEPTPWSAAETGKGPEAAHAEVVKLHEGEHWGYSTFRLTALLRTCAFPLLDPRGEDV